MEFEDRSRIGAFRFDPTDEILVGNYLVNKVLAQPLPHDAILEYDVFQADPSNLPGGEKHLDWLKFFFYNVGAAVFEDYDNRVAGNGQWKILQKHEDVELPETVQWICKKSTFIFWESKRTRSVKTNWTMEEFRVAPKSNPSQVADMAVYRIWKNSGRLQA
ncbi:hypothetical protein Fmac_029314 [Flemingia macrophylla]|uniref:NAC domain-containing protein n=1 Tax=Flemingia macrophylla TaxID=520843 RepID=A0ABD1LBI2_9FABA